VLSERHEKKPVADSGQSRIFAEIKYRRMFNKTVHTGNVIKLMGNSKNRYLKYE
jgi:hypothetical protein